MCFKWASIGVLLNSTLSTVFTVAVPAQKPTEESNNFIRFAQQRFKKAFMQKKKKNSQPSQLLVLDKVQLSSHIYLHLDTCTVQTEGVIKHNLEQVKKQVNTS